MITVQVAVALAAAQDEDIDDLGTIDFHHESPHEEQPDMWFEKDFDFPTEPMPLGSTKSLVTFVKSTELSTFAPSTERPTMEGSTTLYLSIDDSTIESVQNEGK